MPHLLFLGSRTETLSDFVRQLKTGSNLWLQEQRPELQHFHWQNGYGAFSVSQSAVEDVRDCIRHQREHHRVMTFQDEYRKFPAPNTASSSRSGMCGIESRSPALLQSATFGGLVVISPNTQGCRPGLSPSARWASNHSVNYANSLFITPTLHNSIDPLLHWSLSHGYTDLLIN